MALQALKLPDKYKWLGDKISQHIDEGRFSEIPNAIAISDD